MTENAVSTIDLATWSPSEVDTKLAELWPAIQSATARLHAEYQNLVSANKGGRFMGGSSYYTPAAIEGRIEEAKAKIADLEAQAEPFEIEFAKRPWQRYFLVTNTNGHVHRGMNCGTCFPTTQYAWLPNLSGCDEAAMVEEWGELACTVCFPNAPTLPAFHRPSRRDAEAQAARAAEKAARDAEKATKAITALDGSPLKVVTGHSPRDGRPYTETYRTKVAARNALSQAVQSFCWYGPTHPSDFASQARQLIPALEAAGMDPQKVIATAVKKVTKEGAEHGSALMEALAQ